MTSRSVVIIVALIMCIVPYLQVEPPGGEDTIGTEAVPQAMFPDEPAPLDPESILSRMEPSFTENLGQLVDSSVRFYARGHPISLGLQADGIVFRLTDPVGPSSTFRLVFEGCNGVEPRGVGPEGHRTSLFRGSDPDRWVRGAGSFPEVWYDAIYEGVDLRFYFSDGLFKYDVVLGPGVGPEGVVLRYEGIDGLGLDPDDGDLLVFTPAGTVRDQRPILVQEGELVDEAGSVGFRLMGGKTFGFELGGAWDPTLETVIDPGMDYSTLFGGEGADEGLWLATDSGGNVVMLGRTQSPDLTTTTGAFDEDWNGQWDLFVLKFDADLSDLSWVTYIGGSDNESASEVAVMSDDGVLICGATMSPDFPLTTGALDTSFEEEEAFMLKLSEDGTNLVQSSFFGGQGRDYDVGFWKGPDDSVYLAGTTLSPDLPITSGAYCSTYSPPGDLFVAKLPSSMDRVLLCTYVDSPISGPSIQVDGDGNIFVGGTTGIQNLDLNATGFDNTWGGPPMDQIILKLDPPLSKLMNWTYIGGEFFDVAYEMHLGADGSVQMVGYTNSRDYPITPNALKSGAAVGWNLAFVIVSNDLGSVEYGTYYGTTNTTGSDFCWDEANGIIYISGDIDVNGLTPTSGAFDPAYRDRRTGFGTGYEGFIAGFDLERGSEVYITYLGGGSDDYPACIKSLPTGKLLVTGYTASSDFPVSRGAAQSTVAGEEDAFLFVLDPRPCELPTVAPSNVTAVGGQNEVSVSWDPGPIEGGRVYKHNLYRGTTPDEMVRVAEVPFYTDSFIDIELPAGRYYYQVAGVNGRGEGPMSEVVKATPYGRPAAPHNLTASTGDGAVTLRWVPPIGLEADRLTYHIYRGPTRDDLKRIISNLTELEHVDGTVELGTFYYYGVMARNSWGDGVLSPAVRIKPQDVPSPPTDFSLVPGDDRVTLSWGLPVNDGNSLLLGFRVYRGLGSGNMTLLATKGAGQLTHVDKNVTNGVAYIYSVSAFSSVGESLTTTTLDAIPFGLPGEPRDPAAVPGNGEVMITWSSPASDGGRRISHYTILWGTRPGDLPNVQTVGNVTSFHHTGLDNGVTHYYQLAARNEAGDGPVSVVVHATPMGPPGGVTALAARMTPGGMLITWEPPTDMGGAASLTYRVLRDEAGDPQDVIAEVVDETQYLDEDVVRSTTYHYRILVVSGDLTGPSMDPVAALAADAPGKVEGLTAMAGNAHVALAWTTPGDDGGSPVTHYIILRGQFVTGLVEIARVGADKLNHTDSTASNGVSYYYAVRAVNAVGTGSDSDTVEARPLAPPKAPGTLEAKVKGSAIRLAWTAPLSSGEAPVTGYRVYRGTSETDLQLMAELGDVTSYTDDTVEMGVKYHYRVVADSESGEGEISVLASAKVPKEAESPGFGAAVALLSLTAVLAVGLVDRARVRPRR